MTSVIPYGQTITNNTTTTALTPNISCIWVNYFHVLVHDTGRKCIAIYATRHSDTIIVMHGTVCWAPAFKRTLKRLVTCWWLPLMRLSPVSESQNSGLATGNIRTETWSINTVCIADWNRSHASLEVSRGNCTFINIIAHADVAFSTSWFKPRFALSTSKGSWESS